MIIYLPIICRFAYLLYTDKVYEGLYIPAILFLISILFLVFSFRIEFGLIKRALVFIGGISYSTYLIHFPILYLFHSVTLFSGTWYTAAIRLVLYLITVFSISYLLEKKYQSWVMEKIEARRLRKSQNGISLWDSLPKAVR
ncbi:acyltransferase family protein [Rufibacter glacialis]|uniref:acyltransferase family protein n=1 Tax=Rufibacter glacialis TaxID=1259555 RepID=UPI0037437EE3